MALTLKEGFAPASAATAIHVKLASARPTIPRLFVIMQILPGHLSGSTPEAVPNAKQPLVNGRGRRRQRRAQPALLNIPRGSLN